ncbi:MAG TPA: NAD(P)-dependent oxidoreductase [Thermomicrobiales bacterium]|nr:NAD(P)-dependent oxidoreductase [Thermomicrobiales bacterium]
MAERGCVLVTGASGRLGRVVVQELVDTGYEVRGTDRRRPEPGVLPAGVRFIESTLSDVGQVAGAASGCSAVIHLGAIPSPYSHPDEVVFTNNTQATFSVLQAASLVGIRRAAFASSVSAYGMAWAREPFLARYVPLDEAHPFIATDPYALSKEVDERTAEMFTRRDGSTIAALRFHWVAKPEELAHRSGAAVEHQDSSVGVRGLWGYVHIADAARACRLAIEAEPFGFEAFNIVAADTLLDIPTEEALAKYGPEIEVRSPLPGFTSGFAIEKAKRILGWEPQHSWRS